MDVTVSRLTDKLYEVVIRAVRKLHLAGCHPRFLVYWIAIFIMIEVNARHKLGVLSRLQFKSPDRDAEVYFRCYI